MMTKLLSPCEQPVYALQKSGMARRAVDGVDNSHRLSTTSDYFFSWGKPVIHRVPRSMKERMI